MAQISKIRFRDGTVVTPGEWTSADPLYSTVEIQAGPALPSVLVAFSYGRGGSVPGSVGPRNSNLTDTNLQGEGARLPENEDLIIYLIGVEFFKVGLALNPLVFPDADQPNVPLSDMLRLQRDLVMRLKIAAVKDYTDTPVSNWPAGTGVDFSISGGRSFVSGAAANGEIIGNNGSPDVQSQRQLASPLYVAGGESLGIEFRAGPSAIMNLNIAANARYRTRVLTDGIRRRPVA